MALSNPITIRVRAAGAGMPNWYPASAGTIINLSQVLGDSSTQRSAAIAAGVPEGSASLDAFGSAALIYESGRPYLHCHGGGHTDGSWNGTIKYGPLLGAGSNNPTWSLGIQGSAQADVRTCTSTSPATIAAGSTYLDGRMPAIHGYNGPVGHNGRLYIPRADAIYNSGQVNMQAYYLDAATSAQTLLPVLPAGSGNDNGFNGSAADFYGDTMAVWTNGGGWSQLKILNALTETWTVEPNGVAALYGDRFFAKFDQRRGGFLAHSRTSGYGGLYWPSVTPATTRRSGINQPSASGSGAMCYDYDRDVFVVPAQGTLNVQECDAAALYAGGNPSWTTRSFTGVTPPSATYTGRFQYIRELKGYIAVPNATSDVYFYRAS